MVCFPCHLNFSGVETPGVNGRSLRPLGVQKKVQDGEAVQKLEANFFSFEKNTSRSDLGGGNSNVVLIGQVKQHFAYESQNPTRCVRHDRWQLKYFLCSSLFGEDGGTILTGAYFSDGLEKNHQQVQK